MPYPVTSLSALFDELDGGRILGPTSLGPIPEDQRGPSVWRGRTELFRTMWLAIDTCGACLGPMAFVERPDWKGSLSGSYRCLNRQPPMGYDFWNECRPGGRLYVEPDETEQERLWTC